MSAAAGVVIHAKPGNQVIAGQPVLELHTDDPQRIAAAIEALEGAIVVGDDPPSPTPLVLDRITA